MTTTPQVPFDAELLAEIEALLPRGETIMGFVETLPARLSSTEESKRASTSAGKPPGIAMNEPVLPCLLTKSWPNCEQSWTRNESSLADEGRTAACR